MSARSLRTGVAGPGLPVISMKCMPCLAGQHRGPGHGGVCECDCHRGAVAAAFTTTENEQ